MREHCTRWFAVPETLCDETELEADIIIGILEGDIIITHLPLFFGVWQIRTLSSESKLQSRLKLMGCSQPFCQVTLACHLGVSSLSRSLKHWSYQQGKWEQTQKELRELIKDLKLVELDKVNKQLISCFSCMTKHVNGWDGS